MQGSLLQRIGRLAFEHLQATRVGGDDPEDRLAVVAALLITGGLIWVEGLLSLRATQPPTEPRRPYPPASAIIAATRAPATTLVRCHHGKQPAAIQFVASRRQLLQIRPAQKLEAGAKTGMDGKVTLAARQMVDDHGFRLHLGTPQVTTSTVRDRHGPAGGWQSGR